MIAWFAFALVVVASWTIFCLLVVARQESEIAPSFGAAVAPFIQACHNATANGEWVQTVHGGRGRTWAWCQHYGLLYPASCWLSSFSSSPWTLMRVQTLAVGLGGLAAWLLGWAEARLAGALAALALYLGSSCIIIFAMFDYEALIFILPAIVLVIWAARHGGLIACLIAFNLLAVVREEGLLFLPVLALVGGPRRALFAGLVAAAHLAVLDSIFHFEQSNFALADILWRLLHASPQFLATTIERHLPWRYYLGVFSSAFPWMFASPYIALLAMGTAAFQVMPGTAGITDPDSFFHHNAPIVALAVSAAILGVGRLMRWLPRLRYGTLAVVLVLCALGLHQWQGLIVQKGLRVTTGRGEHPAWQLIRRVPQDAVLFVPFDIAPAAALRRWVVEPSGLCGHVLPENITHVIDDGRLEGTEMSCGPPWHTHGRTIAEADGWRLVEVGEEGPLEPSAGAANKVSAPVQ